MSNIIYEIIVSYIIVVNILGLIMMGLDKFKAKTDSWRISERRLFLIALIGGSIGAIAGIYLFRHKTKHFYFLIGMPLILFLQYYILNKLNFFQILFGR